MSNGIRWSKEEENQLKELAEEYTHEKILEIVQKKSGRSYDSIFSKMNRMGLKSAQCKIEPIEYIKRPENVQIDGNLLGEYLSLISRARQIAPPKPKPVFSKNKDGQTLVVFLSDWHLGKLIETSEGIIYNVNIAKKRVDKLIRNLVKLLGYAQQEATIHEIVLVLGGDIIDNEIIYETQAHHIDINVVEQVQVATDLLWNVISALLSNTDKKVIIRVRGVPGNHGRVTFESHEKSNWDTVVYQDIGLIARYSGSNRVIVECSNGDYDKFKIFDHTILNRHGKGVPKQDGTAAAAAKFGGWFVEHKWDIFLYAHYHHIGCGDYHGRPIFRNGSLPGGDDLAERLSLTSPAKQWVFGSSRKRRVTFQYMLDLNV